MAIISDDGMGASIDYMYLNKPENRFKERSRMHHGSCSLSVVGKPVERLKGNYWTNRDTRGELLMNKHSGKIVDDFSQAEALFLEKVVETNE